MRFAVRLATLVPLVFALAAFGGAAAVPVDGLQDTPSERGVHTRHVLAMQEDRGGEERDDDDDFDDDDGQSENAYGNEGIELSTADAGKRRRSARGGCPSSMVRVRDFCIDRYEAPNRRGAKPLVMQSANDAVSWCADHRKRLCTEDEWIGTCEGEDHRTYPYGDTHVDGRCNDDKPWRKVDEATLAKWPAPEARNLARELYQAEPSGSKHKCVSNDGAHDMTGNVEEWVVRTREHDNDWPYLLVGCYWSGCFGGGQPMCRSTNDAHGPEFRYYETGFRCCRDAKTR